jgi:hypothetical protein
VRYEDPQEREKQEIERGDLFKGLFWLTMLVLVVAAVVIVVLVAKSK